MFRGLLFQILLRSYERCEMYRRSKVTSSINWCCCIFCVWVSHTFLHGPWTHQSAAMQQWLEAAHLFLSFNCGIFWFLVTTSCPIVPSSVSDSLSHPILSILPSVLHYRAYAVSSSPEVEWSNVFIFDLIVVLYFPILQERSFFLCSFQLPSHFYLATLI